MKSIKHVAKFVIIVLYVLIYGCSLHYDAGPTQKAINQLETNVSVTETRTPHVNETGTSVPVTIIPTLLFEEAQRLSILLLQNNGECQLPCWWGITPGETTWQDAVMILGPLSMSGSLYTPIETDGVVYVNPPAPTDEHGNVLFHSYYLEDGVVKTIEVYNFDFVSFTYFKEIIAEFGIPDEMYIRGWQDSGFSLVLFYPNTGLLVEYSQTLTSSTENNAIICYEEANSPFLFLWEANHPMTFEEAVVNLRVPTEDFPSLVSVNEAVLNLNEFVASLVKLEEKSCIETPKELWPTKY